jgi:hypothetical protein
LSRTRDTLLGLVALLPSLLALDGFALAAGRDDGSTDTDSEEQPEAANTRSSEAKAPAAPTAPAPSTTEDAAATPARDAFLERMGPDTYPGRLRGIEGGSLWLEPSFHGLQWPQNARTGIGVSGYAWIDTGYQKIVRERPQLVDSSTFFMPARGVLRVTPAYVDGDFFVQGQVELVGTTCQTATSIQALNPNTVCATNGIITTDDLSVRVGHKNRWDLRVGRFQGWEVFHLGMGLEQYTLERLGAGMFGVDPATNPRLEVPTLYAANYLQDRSTDGMAVGSAAVHAYFTDFLRVEVLARLGNDNFKTDETTGRVAFSYYGARPALVLDLGWLKLKGAAEYEQRTPMTQILSSENTTKKDSPESMTRKGAGGSLAFVVAPFVEFGVNAAIGVQHHVDPLAKVIGRDSYTTKTVGAFANARLFPRFIVGVGGAQTTQLDKFLTEGSSSNDWIKQLQGFGAVQYVLANQLYIKAVVAYARADFQPSDPASPIWHNTMLSGRLRLMYLF